MNEAKDSKFVTSKLNIVNDQSDANYDIGNEIIYSTQVLKSKFSDYSNAYILVAGDITVIAHAATQVASRNYATFIEFIT